MPFSLQMTDIALDESHLARATTAILDRKLEPRAAYVSGSIAAGLGNVASDLDVVVIVDEVSEQFGSSVHGSVRVEVEQLSWTDLLSLCRRVTTFEATGRDRSQINMPGRSLLQLSRFIAGKDIIGSTELNLLRGTVSLPALRKIAMARHACESALAAEDAVGARDSGDLATAVSSSHNALCLAGEVAAACFGDLYLFSPKFMFRRLERTGGGRGLATMLWSLLHVSIPTDLDVADVEALIGERLLVANGVVARCMTQWWSAAPTSTERISVGDDGPRRSPQFGLVRFADGFAMPGPATGFRISEEGALVWSLLDGLAVAEIVLRFAELTHADPESVDLPVRDAVGAMVHSGVAEWPGEVCPEGSLAEDRRASPPAASTWAPIRDVGLGARCPRSGKLIG